MKSFKNIIIGLAIATVLPVSGQALPDDGPLTINKHLQSLAQRLLKNKQGSIIAIEPSTGKILCMVSHNKVNDGINRAIAIDYSPGSTFKTAQALTLISEKELFPNTEYSCRKGFYTDGIHIGCHAHQSPLALIQAIGQSCNSYFCKAFKDFVDDRKKYPTKYAAINIWHQYMSSMGFGQPLGIDMPGEVGGLLPDVAYLQKTHKGNWNGTTIMWVGMGQGEIRTTPLQLCNLAASIANRGWWYTPHIHKSTAVHPLNSTYTTKHICMPTQEAYKLVIEGMRATVINGTATSIRSPHYKICGKTGTAENTGYDHSIFMGFAPMDKPKIAVSVYVENGGFGADLAAPLAGLIMEQYIMGKLSAASEAKAKKWSNKQVKITKVEIPINLDSL